MKVILILAVIVIAYMVYKKAVKRRQIQRLNGAPEKGLFFDSIEFSAKVRKLEKLVQAKLVSIYADINIDMDIAMTIYVFDNDIKINHDSKNRASLS